LGKLPLASLLSSRAKSFGKNAAIDEVCMPQTFFFPLRKKSFGKNAAIDEVCMPQKPGNALAQPI
jgi:hypothetical protein